MRPDRDAPRYGNPFERWGWPETSFLGAIDQYDVWLMVGSQHRWIWANDNHFMNLPPKQAPRDLTPYGLCKHYQICARYTDGIPPTTHNGDPTDD